MKTFERISRVKVVVVICAALLALVSASSARAQDLEDPSLDIEAVVPVGTFNQPTTMAFLAPNDFLVLEKTTGEVHRVLNGAALPAPVLTVPVNFSSERGLLGIAINTETPRSVFLYFTEAAVLNGPPIANRVYRYTWNAALGQLVSPTLILDLPVTTGPNHDGGVLLLGPPGQFPGVGDGAALYTVIGDLNFNGQLQNNVTGALPDDRGVIFRVRQDGTPVPGNPFTPYCSVTTTQTCVNDAACGGGQTCQTRVARYYAYGVRNSFGLGLDPVTGSLWDTENGPASMDEINRVVPGMNSGWIDLMGPDSLDPDGTAGLFNMPGAGLTYSDPEFSWNNTVAPTAIVFPIGSSLGPDYDEVALVADNNFGQLYSFPLNPTRTGFSLGGVLADLVAGNQTEANTVRFGSEFGAVTDLELGPDGDLYAVDIANGTVYRISGPAPDTDLDGILDVSDNCPTVANAGQQDGGGGLEVPADGVGDACDNCVTANNPRQVASYLTTNPWRTLTGGQIDDDHDGYGNKCDAKFTGSPSAAVGGLDLGQFRTSSGEDRRSDTCGTVGGSRPCAIFDLDEAAAGDAIGGLDLGRFRQLSGATPGPRCAACTGTGSAPLPCTAGTAGSCSP
jgi:glucose/arabinose dehydrogenase